MARRPGPTTMDLSCYSCFCLERPPTRET